MENKGMNENEMKYRADTP